MKSTKLPLRSKELVFKGIKRVMWNGMSLTLDYVTLMIKSLIRNSMSNH